MLAMVVVEMELATQSNNIKFILELVKDHFIPLIG